MSKKHIIHYVRDISTINPPLSTQGDTTLPLVIFYMNLMKVGASAVIDKENHFIGLVINEDVADFFDRGRGIEKEPLVRDIMLPPHIVVYLDDPLERALFMMNRHKIDWLPVIDFDTHKFSGLVCRDDLENLPWNATPFLKVNFSHGKAA